MNDLSDKHCKACEGGIPRLTQLEIPKYLQDLPTWVINEDYSGISRTFHFKNFFKTMAFVNMVAWVAHQENHHPVMKVGFNECTLYYSTHAVLGLTENDFICAANINRFIDDSP